MSRLRRVLVFGDDTRSFLALVRSLGRVGVTIDAAPYNFRSPALSSRYIRHIHRLSLILDDGTQWCQELNALVEHFEYDILIPCDERALLPLNQFREQFENKTILAIPARQHVVDFFDKVNTRRIAIACDVPVAPGRVLSEKENVNALAAEFGLPCVIKPRASYELATLYSRRSVSVVRTKDELAHVLRDVDESYHDENYYIEQFLPGSGVGVSVLARDGELLQAFQHHREHELLDSGGSSYRVSAPLNADYEGACVRIVRNTKYTGLAMFEFLCDQSTGKWNLLEVNARPWGSLPLAIASGVDFPYLWCQMLMGEYGANRKTYKTPYYARNTINDLYSILKIISQRDGLTAKVATIFRAIGELGRIVSGREVNDAITRDDARPGVVELWDFALEKVGVLLDRTPIARAVRRAYRAQRNRRNLKAVLKSRKEDLPLNIVFLCQDNICRSPFAERLAKQLAYDTGLHITFSSAGMLPRFGRPSPRNALLSARAFDVELDTHRSIYFSEQLAQKANLVVVFDEKSENSALNRYPFLMNAIIRLSSLTPNSAVIEDPDGRDLSFFNDTYGRIHSAVQKLIIEIRKARLEIIGI